MRRRDREVLGEEVYNIIAQCSTMSLAVIENGKPYVVTVNFGLLRKGEHTEIVFHCADEGRKLRGIAQNPAVAFTMVANGDVQRHPLACRWTVNYQSVYGEGIAEVVPDAEKKPYFDAIMRQAGQDGPASYDAETMERTTLVRIAVSSLTGKAKL